LAFIAHELDTQQIIVPFERDAQHQTERQNVIAVTTGIKDDEPSKNEPEVEPFKLRADTEKFTPF
jgi:hypothetical protein